MHARGREGADATAEISRLRAGYDHPSRWGSRWAGGGGGTAVIIMAVGGSRVVERDENKQDSAAPHRSAPQFCPPSHNFRAACKSTTTTHHHHHHHPPSQDWSKFSPTRPHSILPAAFYSLLPPSTCPVEAYAWASSGPVHGAPPHQRPLVREPSLGACPVRASTLPSTPLLLPPSRYRGSSCHAGHQPLTSCCLRLSSSCLQPWEEKFLT